MIKKIIIIILCMGIFIAFKARSHKQCVVCIYEDSGKKCLTEPHCNTGSHPERNRCLCHEEAETICKEICAKFGKKHIKAQVWETN